MKVTEALESALVTFDHACARFGSPTVREWVEMDGRSYATIIQHRNALLAAGLLEHDPGRHKSTRITEEGRRALRNRRRRLART